MLEAVCPNGHRLQVPLEHAGMKLRCPAPGCGVIFQLSATSPTGATTPVSPSGILQAGNTPAAAPPPNVAAQSAPQQSSPGYAPAPQNYPPPQQPGGSQAAPPIPTQPLSEATGSRWSGTDAPAGAAQPQPQQQATPPAPAPLSQSGPIPRGPGVTMPRPSMLGAGSWTAWTQALLMIGLTLVLTARGCESLGARNVARLAARVEQEKQAFENAYEIELAGLEAEQAAAKNDKERTDSQKRIDDLKKLHVNETRDRNVEWMTMTSAATEARASNIVWGFWREMLFVAGTIVFALGLLAVGLGAGGVERYFALGMLAIIVFSIYVGGVAWFSSLAGAVGGLK
jgi:hypothetical protein